MTNLSNKALLAYMQTYPTNEADFQAFDLPAEDIVDGNPKTEVAVHYQSDDGSILVGVSRFTEGTYRYHQTADEINYVTEGRMIITSDRDNQEIDCKAGSVTRLDKGVVYTKQVIEPYEEIFVMLSDGAAAVQM